MFIVEAESLDPRYDDKIATEHATLEKAAEALRTQVQEELNSTDWGEDDDPIAQRDINDRKSLLANVTYDYLVPIIREKGRAAFTVGDPSYLEVEYRIISRPHNDQ